MFFLDFFSEEEILQFLLLSCFSISFSLIGSFLYLKKKAMIANAISHTVLFGIALLFIGMKIFLKKQHLHLFSLNSAAYVLVAIVTSFITIFCIEGLKKFTLLKNDASTAYVFSTLFSIGVVLITLFTKSSHVGVDVIMGDLDLIHKDDLYLSFTILILAASFVALFFKDLIALSFDSTLFHFNLKKATFLQLGFLFLTSLTITSGFRFVGIAPVLGLIIIPTVSSSLFSKSVKELIFFSIYSNIGVNILTILFVKFFYLKFGVGLSTSGMLVSLHVVLLLFLMVKKSKMVTT
jgi:manganese/zinc/iron transport system permease protein